MGFPVSALAVVATLDRTIPMMATVTRIAVAILIIVANPVFSAIMP